MHHQLQSFEQKVRRSVLAKEKKEAPALLVRKADLSLVGEKGSWTFSKNEEKRLSEARREKKGQYGCRKGKGEVTALHYAEGDLCPHAGKEQGLSKFWEAFDQRGKKRPALFGKKRGEMKGKLVFGRRRTRR